MNAYLARTELRRHWRGLVLLAVLVALVTGTVLTATAGARRSRSAFDRYLEALHPIDIGVFGDDRAALAAVTELPHVEAAAQIELAAITPVGEPTDSFFPMMVSLDGLLPGEYMRPRVLEGRLPDLAEPLAVALGEHTARRLGKGIGDRIPMVSFTPDGALAAFGDEGTLPVPDGPTFDLEVVGLVREPADLTGRETDLAFTMLTPAFRDLYPDEAIGQIGLGAFVVLDDQASLLEFTEAVGALNVQIDSTVSPRAARTQADPTMAALATALYVFAVVAGLSGLVAVGQAVSRGAQTPVADDRTLEALGVPRFGRWARLVLPRAAAVVAGATAGALLALAASPLMPIGLARRAEPDPGLDLDGTVVGLGLLGAALVGCALVGLVVASAMRMARVRTDRARPSRLARAAADAGASPSTVLGLSMAAGGRSPSTVAARAALGGAAMGVLGLVAATVFATSVDRLVASPELYGWGWDANLAGTDVTDLPDGAVDEASLLADPDINAVAEVVFSLELSIDGDPAFGIALDDRKAHVEAVMVRGRQPSADGEVALAGETLETIGKRVGDTVAIELGEGSRDLLITGVTSLPVSDDGGSSAVGALMTRGAADGLGFAGDCEDEATCYINFAVDLRPGADLDEVLGRHTDLELGTAADVPHPPGEVERLVAVERMPWFLAAFLGLLATVAVANGAITAVRRRRRDLAILRVLGLSGRQVRAVVTTQVATVSLAGAAIGALAGVIVGRVIWRSVVDSVPLPFSPATPVGAVVGIVSVTLVLAQLAAIAPRRAAARLRPADVLRAE